jgi:nucleoside-diphosphate-sugar epimerase
MEIFITGATGVLGRATIPNLLEAGHRVRALARSAVDAQRFRDVGVEPIVGDLFDESTLARGLSGADAVMHLATRIPPAARLRSRDAWRENDRIRTEGTQRLLKVARSAGVHTFVYPSVSFVYAGDGDGWIDAEEGVVLAPWTVASSLEAERMVESFAAEGRRAIVLRLGVLYGPGNPLVADLLAAARRGLSAVVGRADGYQSSLWSEDAATAFVAALGAPSGTYDVVDDEPMRRRDIDAVLAGIVGRRSVRRLPERIQRLMAGAGAPFLFASQRVSNRRFQEATGWRPSVPSMRVGLPIAAEAARAERTPIRSETAMGTPPLVTLALGFLAVLTMTLGAWQMFAPESFFFQFPGGGFAWVHTDGPYNEHLVRDLGGPTLALGILAAWALADPSRRAVRAVGLMTVIPSVPHFIYHVATLDLLPTVLDQVLQTATLAVGLLAGVILLVAPLSGEGRRTVPDSLAA